MGYIIASFGSSFALGHDSIIGKTLFIASFSHIIFHSLFKSTLFLSIGTTVDSMNNRNVYEIRGDATHLLSISKSHIITIISFFIAACSIMGIPLFNGFYSKYLI
jgi:formate hydrogenlyase subunit 3/multisubunit Na+/H+ antiporter MnhD subunit